MIEKYGKWYPEIHRSCFIAPGSYISGDVKIAEHCGIWHNAVIRGDMAMISIGKMSNIQDCAVLHCTKGLTLNIGDLVTVGHSAVLHSCSIGDAVLIGMNAVVLDGASIGSNCLIGAGALITPGTIIPDGSLVVGNPGRVKRQLTDEEIKSIMDNANEYVNCAEDYLGNQ